jgi:hypothetical protein
MAVDRNSNDAIYRQIKGNELKRIAKWCRYHPDFWRHVDGQWGESRSNDLGTWLAGKLRFGSRHNLGQCEKHDVVSYLKIISLKDPFNAS